MSMTLPYTEGFGLLYRCIQLSICWSSPVLHIERGELDAEYRSICLSAPCSVHDLKDLLILPK